MLFRGRSLAGRRGSSPWRRQFPRGLTRAKLHWEGAAGALCLSGAGAGQPPAVGSAEPLQRRPWPRLARAGLRSAGGSEWSTEWAQRSWQEWPRCGLLLLRSLFGAPARTIAFRSTISRARRGGGSPRSTTPDAAEGPFATVGLGCPARGRLRALGPGPPWGAPGEYVRPPATPRSTGWASLALQSVDVVPDLPPRPECAPAPQPTTSATRPTISRSADWQRLKRSTTPQREGPQGARAQLGRESLRLGRSQSFRMFAAGFAQLLQHAGLAAKGVGQQISGFLGLGWRLLCQAVAQRP